MTIVCAVYDAENRKFWLGSNSGNLVGETILPEHRTKWLRFANWAIALAGVNAACDALEMERAKFPNQTTEVSKVMGFIRDAFAKFELGEVRNGVRDFGVSGLIARAGGELFHFDSGLSASRVPEGVMWACGSGMTFAVGAESAMRTKGFGAQERIENAVLAAIDLDCASPGEPLIEQFD